MIERYLRKLARFAELPGAERDALQTAFTQVSVYGRHDVIARQGDKPSECCLILEGVAARVKGLADGKRQILSFQFAGDFSDLHSLFLRSLDHSIEALSSVRLGRIPHSAVNQLIADHPQLARAFAWDMAVDGAIQREWMTSMGRRSAYKQTAHVLCEMLIRLRTVGLADEDSYKIPITQADLADAFGMSTVHVNRTLQTLRKDGLIELKGGSLRIPDAAALKAAAGFDPSYLE